MQQFNFSPLDFSRIPQQETQARQNWYGSLSGMANTFGQGVQKLGEAQDTINQRNLAEEWKQKQWNNQRWRQDLEDQRYQDELNRRIAGEKSQQEAAEALRTQFLNDYGETDLSDYGLGAQFAMAQIRNARNWNDVVSGGSNLTNIINQRDLLRQQQLEEQRASEGETLFNTIGGEMSSSGMDLGRMGEVYNEQFIKGQPVRTKQNRMSQLRQLKNWRDRLKAFSDAHPERMSPQMQERLYNLNAAIRYWNWRMGEAPVSF